MKEDYRNFQERERKIVVDGTLNYSFGKNGPGLSDEFLLIGNLIDTLSKDNHIYLEKAFIDACDDVYDLKFRIIPHRENAWMVADPVATQQEDLAVDAGQDSK